MSDLLKQDWTLQDVDLFDIIVDYCGFKELHCLRHVNSVANKILCDDYMIFRCKHFFGVNSIKSLNINECELTFEKLYYLSNADFESLHCNVDGCQIEMYSNITCIDLKVIGLCGSFRFWMEWIKKVLFYST